MLRDISLHIMDLCENSIKAGADSIDIYIKADYENDRLTIKISDNGSGMNEEFLKNVIDPFTTGRTTRDVGLGIPFFKLSCEMTGGSINIWSELSKGTVIEGYMILSHIDRLPLGNLGETFVSLIISEPKNKYRLRLESNSNMAIISTEDILKELDGIPITEFSVLSWIKNYVNGLVTDIFKGNI